MIPVSSCSFNSYSIEADVDFVDKAYSAGNIPIRAVEKPVDDVDETRFLMRQNESGNARDCKKIVADAAEKSE